MSKFIQIKEKAQPEQKLYLIGKKYKEEKKEGFKGNQYMKSGGGKNYHQQKTAQKIAEETKVSEKTVRNAEKFAEAIDTIAETAGNIKRKRKR